MFTRCCQGSVTNPACRNADSAGLLGLLYPREQPAAGVEHLIATEAEVAPDGRFTGRPAGTPSFREGKVARVREWLGSLGHRFEDFTETWFYGDSHNDLPLLEVVSMPVAVDPDPLLEGRARERGWPILRMRA